MQNRCYWQGSGVASQKQTSVSQTGQPLPGTQAALILLQAVTGSDNARADKRHTWGIVMVHALDTCRRRRVMSTASASHKCILD